MSSSLAPEDVRPGRRATRRRSPYLLVALALLAGAVVPTALLLRRSDAGPAGAPERGDRAPAFAARTQEGEIVSLDGFDGRPVVLHFCGSWNPLCEDDLGYLAEARDEAADPDLVIVDVLVNDDLGQAHDLYRDQGADWIVVADPDERIADAYGVRAVPQSFFIDRDGRVAARNFGALAPTTLSGRIDDLLR